MTTKFDFLCYLFDNYFFSNFSGINQFQTIKSLLQEVRQVNVFSEQICLVLWRCISSRICKTDSRTFLSKFVHFGTHVINTPTLVSSSNLFCGCILQCLGCAGIQSRPPSNAEEIQNYTYLKETCLHSFPKLLGQVYVEKDHGRYNLTNVYILYFDLNLLLHQKQYFFVSSVYTTDPK